MATDVMQSGDDQWIDQLVKRPSEREPVRDTSGSDALSLSRQAAVHAIAVLLFTA